MSKTWYEPDFGPHIPFREYSLMNNTDLPDSVKASVAYVTICKKGQVGCAVGDNPATLEGNRVAIAENMKSHQIQM